jgi:NAD(P)-dependent dehydrogenase (short-subunit alcohol dehydrogenase family)
MGGSRPGGPRVASTVGAHLPWRHRIPGLTRIPRCLTGRDDSYCSKSEDLDSTFDWAFEQFGRFDIAFNNAGISGEDLFADESGDCARIIAFDLIAVVLRRARPSARVELGSIVSVTLDEKTLMTGLHSLAMVEVMRPLELSTQDFGRRAGRASSYWWRPMMLVRTECARWAELWPHLHSSRLVPGCSASSQADWLPTAPS